MMDARAGEGIDLPTLARMVRTHPGVTAKSEIGLVSEIFQSTDWLAGPGDDGAVVTERGMALVVGGEAILPSFVAADPYGAGVAAVTTNLNDLAAMGAWPLALVDTITGPRPIIRRVLEGMRWASGLYQVPVVGGHLTVTDGPPGLGCRCWSAAASRGGCDPTSRSSRRSTSAAGNWRGTSGCWPRARRLAGWWRPRM
jgi:hydrogenase maturation factor HypE